MIGSLALKRVGVMFIKANTVVNYQGTLKTSKMHIVSSWYKTELTEPHV